jgi:hypothetical protein
VKPGEPEDAMARADRRPENADDIAAGPVADDAIGASSPLWLVSSEPALSELVVTLQRARAAYAERPGSTQALRFSLRRLREARDGFAAMIRRGELQLHRLSRLLCDRLLRSYQRQGVIIGQVEGTGERFTLTVDVSPDELFACTDLDFGTRRLDRLRVLNGGEAERATLVSNVIEYQATEPNGLSIYKIVSRVKAEEEIWNKVTDEIFNLDGIVLRDKKLRHLSRYVKDVFGIKIVVGTARAAYKTQSRLARLTWKAAHLRDVGVEPGDLSRSLNFVEVKDYLSRAHRKRSGWSALKSVVRWCGKTFELQVQPLSNYLHERELLTQESHAAFKLKRERVRDEVAAQLPLFAFYRDLLRWLLIEPVGRPPRHDGIRVLLDD